MAPSSVTCPNCQTTFRITNAQLKATNGSMRCGSCLQIFNAMDQVEQPKKEESKETIGYSEYTPTTQKKEDPAVQPKQQQPLEKLVVRRHKPIKKTRPSQAEKNWTKKGLDPSIKAKVATTPIEYDGYHQQSIETLIQELDKRETEKSINKQQRKKRAYWIVAACSLMALLTLQFAWFNRNTLSLNPTLRPTYATVCKLLPCSLPPLANINAIRIIDLVVRSHPDRENALQIDAVIMNDDRHPQPFPDLKLTFTDINGRLVADRTFTPFEYLGGDLADSQEMPNAQPIRIGLEILDPGERAVNYQLTFSRNKATRFN